jgi:hypothetical protein
MLFAFVVGFASTYNCGGGSSSQAAGDADTLQGHPASDFALSSHQHDAGDITSGVLDISLIPSHTHANYALSSHSHDDYADSNHSHVEYMDAVNSCSNNQVLKWSGSAWVCAEDIDTVNTDAETLDGYDSTDFAYSYHSHYGITPGVFPIGASAFNGRNIYQSSEGSNISNEFSIGSKGHAAVTLPFKCTIVGMEAEVRNESPSSEVYVELHDGENLNATYDTFTPIVAFDTSSFAPTSDHVIISSPAFSYAYDPADLYKYPLWVSVWLDAYSATPPAVSSRQRLWWVKIYYTVP